MEDKFTWVEFYTKFADVLLGYKDNRELLLKKLHTVFDNVKLQFPTLEKNGKATDIDPFTVYGMFNRKLKEENRIRIIEGIAKEFNITTKTPKDVNGIPVLTIKTSFFVANRGTNDIDNLWHLFEVTLKLSDNDSMKSKEKFKIWFDKVMLQKGIKWNITMGLFWIRPLYFISLDKPNQDVIRKYQKLGQLPNSFNLTDKQKIKADEYLAALNAVKELINSGITMSKNIAEFSYNASEGKIPELTPNPKPKPVVPEKKYWWLIANPKMWDLKGLEIGGRRKYTLHNENNNLRKIAENFRNAKVGDIVFGYEASPTKAIVSILEVSRSANDIDIEFVKKENLVSPITYSNLKNDEILKDIQGLGKQGSLFSVKERQAKRIFELIQDYNPSPVTLPNKYSDETFLESVYINEEELSTLKNLVKRKKNIVLQGAPGVGKTFVAKRLAYCIMGLKDDTHVQVVQFHQNYSYEDFVIGYKPIATEGQVLFELKDGCFKAFCDNAAQYPDEAFFFIIDEINRGNLSKIFGELLMLIENDKRGEEHTIKLAYGDTEFYVPENVYIIGMMNTADRSLALIDYALRRRFAFYTMKPAFDNITFKNYQKQLNNSKFDQLIEAIKKLNKNIADDAALGEGFCIGHSYFCELKNDDTLESYLREIIEYDIADTLREYWFENKKIAETEIKKLNEVVNSDKR